MTTSEPIRILIVEDLDADFDLAQYEIRKALKDPVFQRVQTRQEFLDALDTFQPDVILSDYSLPHFDGLTALKLALEYAPLTPLIIWTGSLSEDTAVDCIKAGANNYILKENIMRLGPAIVHALEERRLLLDRQRAELERENLIAELTVKNAELERFTYAVSHDLKSPLVTIKGFLGYLEQDAMAGNVERFMGDSKRIANAVDRMGQLLDDLLELSRIGRFVNPPEKISFEELAREVVDLLEVEIREHEITVDIKPNLPLVYADRVRLLEVLQNLLDNAVKNMGDQPQPHIEIGRCGEDAKDGKTLFYVKDNGVGIAPEYHEFIFGLFNKLDARTEGTGIGLALAKRIIEYHGGRIWVESKVGAGSAFCFTVGEHRDSI